MIAYAQLTTTSLGWFVQTFTPQGGWSAVTIPSSVTGRDVLGYFANWIGTSLDVFRGDASSIILHAQVSGVRLRLNLVGVS